MLGSALHQVALPDTIVSICHEPARFFGCKWSTRENELNTHLHKAGELLRVIPSIFQLIALKKAAQYTQFSVEEKFKEAHWPLQGIHSTDPYLNTLAHNLARVG